MIYVASPYSHPDLAVRGDRYQKVMDYCYHCLLNKINVYSPILHFHAMSLRFQLPATQEPYHRHNVEMMEICEDMHVLALDGWRESRGLADEIRFFRRWTKPIKLVNPNDPTDIHPLPR